MTHNDNRLGPGQSYGETAAFTFGRKVFLAKNAIFPSKSTQNLPKDWYLFGKRVLFCLHNFSWSWPEHGCHMTPNFDNGLFVALGETVHLPPWDLFFDFSSQNYSRFFVKKTKSANRLMFIWKKGTFWFAQLFLVVARTWLEPRSARIWAQKSFFLARNLGFGPENPIFAIWRQFWTMARL